MDEVTERNVSRIRVKSFTFHFLVYLRHMSKVDNFPFDQLA